MTIRQRITLLVVLAFAALTLVGGFAVQRAARSASDVRQVTEGVVPSAIDSVTLLGQLKDVQLSAQAMVAADNDAIVQQTRGELSGRMRELEAALDKQLARADSQAQAGLVREAQEGLKNYFAAIEDTAKMRLAGQRKLAEANMAATVEQYLREQAGLLGALQVEKTRSKDAAIAGVNVDLQRTRSLLIAITVAAALVLGILGALLYRQILRPLVRMQSKMTQIAREQDYSQRMQVERKDEIGRSMLAFNLMIERIEASDRVVREKTAEIASMLHTVPLGILMVVPGGTVHPEVSDQLRVVLGGDEVAGRPVVEAVFAGASLGADALDALQAALGSILGEDTMNFEFNAHLLPRELERRGADGQDRVLDLAWAPMTGADQTVQRVLLCLRDVTELRALERQARAQQRELALVGEILAVPHERFEDFVASASRCIDDSADVLAQGEAAARPGATPIDLLFRHMHTVKGNARTLGLRQLADAAHAAEDRYARVRRGEDAFDALSLGMDLDQVREVLGDYLRLAREKLGRRGGEQGGVHLSAQQLQGLVRGLELAASEEPEALRSAVRHSLDALRHLGTIPVDLAVRPVADAIPELAAALGKPTPRLEVAAPGIGLAPAAAGLLRDVLMHLVRNSLDHGLEPAGERLACGKAPAGLIRLHARHTDGMLVLELRDDGRGLALTRVRERAVAAGLLAADAQPGDAALAQLVFAPGLSTASAVTDVSGRGVGMDAVRALIEEVGGSIVLELAGGAEGAAWRGFTTRIALPAAWALGLREHTGEVVHG